MYACVVQWLGFYPSKVEVRVRFTALAVISNQPSFYLFLSRPPDTG